MDLSTTASAAQLALSAATAAVAFAVYRVQADKLFLEMRESRIAALDRYRDAMNARLAQVSAINGVNWAEQLTVENLQAPMPAQWTAELEIKRWFGPEMQPLMKATDHAVGEAMQAKVSWCTTDRGKAGDFQLVSGMHFSALKVLDETLGAANPYIQAGRRGLPLSATVDLWRSRLARRK